MPPTTRAPPREIRPLSTIQAKKGHMKMTTITAPEPELWFPADVLERTPGLIKSIKKKTNVLDPAHAAWREYVAARLPGHVNEYLRIHDRARVAEFEGHRGQLVMAPGARGFVINKPQASDDVVAQIVRDGTRCWDAYLTLLAIERARDEI